MVKPYEHQREGIGRRDTDKCEIRCERMEDMQESINKKPSWPGINVYMSLVLIIVIGAFAYVTLTSAGLRDYVREENERQDKVIGKIFEKIDKNSEKLEDIKIIVSNHQAMAERSRR